MQALGLVWGDVDSRARDYRERSILIETPTHPGAVLTLSVWRKRMREGGFVIGRDIPSRALSSVLRNLAVYEPIDGGQDFRVRIAGTAFYRRFGRDVTGERFSALFDPSEFSEKSRFLHEMAQTSQPVCLDIERAQGSRASARFELLVMPVRAPRRDENWALAGIFFHDWVS